MGVNIRVKGQVGEREIADMLNGILYSVAKELDFSQEDCVKAANMVQRNQMQTAVGGNDLTNCFGLSIEIKRQEQLAVNTWWKQCCAAAERNGEMPVLMYRQNRKPWRVRTYVWITLPNNMQQSAVAEFDEDTFRAWFREWVKAKLKAGESFRV